MNLDLPLGTALRELGVPIESATVELFDRLSGTSFGSCSFVPDLRRARALIETRPFTDPIFLLPIGSMDHHFGLATLALHLRPTDIMARSLPLVAISTGRNFCHRYEVAHTVEYLTNFCQRSVVAPSVEYLVWRSLAREERVFGCLIPEDVARANELFGVGFYQSGEQSRLTNKELARVLCERSGGDADSWQYTARFADGDRALPYEHAMLVARDYFVHPALAACSLYEKDPERAAQYAARSLGCYQYTCLEIEEAEYSELLSELLAAFPTSFSSDARMDVSLFCPDEARLEAEAVRMIDAARLDRAVKLLFAAQHWSEDPGLYHGRLHDLFTRLDWKWATALVALRT